MPLVSIVTPVFNASAYLPRTWDSVAAQSVQDWEWILVDDRSSDGSPDLIRSWSDARLRLVATETNLGAGAARNLGLSLARGRMVAFLDADDWWAPNKLRDQLDHMAATGAYFTYTGFHYVSESGRLTGATASPPESMSYKAALRNTTILTSTVMIDRQAIDAAALSFPDLRRGQDTALWWSLLREFGPAKGMSQPLTNYRQVAGSLSSNRFVALRRTWHLYRRHEQLPFLRACVYFARQVLNALVRRRRRTMFLGASDER